MRPWPPPTPEVRFTGDTLLVPVPVPRRRRALQLARRWVPLLLSAVAVLFVLLDHPGAISLGLVLLAGQETEGASAGATSNVEKPRCWQVEATKTGTIETLKLHTTTGSNTATKVQMAVLKDSGSNTPGTLIEEKQKEEAVAENALYEVTGFKVEVTAGTKYWLAVNPLGGQLRWKSGTGAGGAKATAICKKISEASWTTENIAPIFFAALGQEVEAGGVKLEPAAATASTTTSLVMASTGQLTGTTSAASSSSMLAVAPVTVTPAVASAATSGSMSAQAVTTLAPAAASASSSSIATMSTTGQLAGTVSAATSSTMTAAAPQTLVPATSSATSSATATLSTLTATMLVPAAANASASTSNRVTVIGQILGASAIAETEAAAGPFVATAPMELTLARAKTSRSLKIFTAGSAPVEPPTFATIASFSTSSTLPGFTSASVVTGASSAGKFEPTPTVASLSGG